MLSIRRPILVCCLLLLTACESPLQKLHALNPSTDDFTGSLASEYLSYADSEAEQGRKLVAEHYAGKGLKAMQGEVVEPEPIDTSLPQDEQDELTAARTQLVALLTPKMKKEAPQELARAQLLFDCWQHEIRKRINQELAPCEDEFKSVMTDLDSFAYNEETRHTLTFAKASAKLTSKDRAIIKNVARQVAHLSNYTVDIAAPGAMGSAEHKLMAARLATVHTALVKIGVAEKYIRVKREADNKKVYLSCDVSPQNANTVTVTVETQ